MDKLNTFGQTREMESEGNGKVSSQGLSNGAVDLSRKEVVGLH